MTWRSSGSITVSTPGSFVQQSPSTCCGLAGYWGQGGQTRPPLQGRGSAVTWTALGRAKAARGGVGQLSDTRPLSRSFGTTSGCGTSCVARHERRLPARLREVLGERGREGTRWHLPELRMHVCAKAGRVHFQISTDRRHTPSHLSTTLPTRERSRQASGHRAGAKMVAPPPCWGAQTTQSPLLQPWGPQDPGEALGDEQAKGHVAVDAPAQARLEVTRLPARKPSLTLKGRPAWLQCSRTKAPHAPTPR